MTLAPLMIASTAAQGERVLRRAAGQPSLTFAPLAMVGGIVTSGVAYDAIGSRHLRASGTYASRGAVGGRYGLGMTFGADTMWEASDSSLWRDTTGSWAWFFVVQFASVGNGSFWISTLKGPARDNPYNVTEVDYGEDRGAGCSTNGDAGAGFAVNGATGNLNADTVGITVADGAWHVGAFGFTSGSGTAWHAWDVAGSAIAHQGDPDAPTRQGHTVGSLTSTDGALRLGADYYGQGPRSGGTGTVGLLWLLRGTAADNLFQYSATILPDLARQVPG